MTTDRTMTTSVELTNDANKAMQDIMTSIDALRTLAVKEQNNFVWKNTNGTQPTPA